MSGEFFLVPLSRREHRFLRVTKFNKGNALFDMERYNEAVSAYDHVIKYDPDNCVVWVVSALALRKGGNYKVLLKSIEKNGIDIIFVPF